MGEETRVSGEFHFTRESKVKKSKVYIVLYLSLEIGGIGGKRVSAAEIASNSLIHLL